MVHQVVDATRPLIFISRIWDTVNSVVFHREAGWVDSAEKEASTPWAHVPEYQWVMFKSRDSDTEFPRGFVGDADRGGDGVQHWGGRLSRGGDRRRAEHHGRWDKLLACVFVDMLNMLNMIDSVSLSYHSDLGACAIAGRGAKYGHNLYVWWAWWASSISVFWLLLSSQTTRADFVFLLAGRWWQGFADHCLRTQCRKEASTWAAQLNRCPESWNDSVIQDVPLHEATWSLHVFVCCRKWLDSEKSLRTQLEHPPRGEPTVALSDLWIIWGILSLPLSIGGQLWRRSQYNVLCFIARWRLWPQVFMSPCLGKMSSQSCLSVHRKPLGHRLAQSTSTLTTTADTASPTTLAWHPIIDGERSTFQSWVAVRDSVETLRMDSAESKTMWPKTSALLARARNIWLWLRNCTPCWRCCARLRQHHTLNQLKMELVWQRDRECWRQKPEVQWAWWRSCWVCIRVRATNAIKYRAPAAESRVSQRTLGKMDLSQPHSYHSNLHYYRRRAKKAKSSTWSRKDED